MSLILSGTDGLSDVDGSASTPAIRGTDTNTGIFFPAADTIAFTEGGVEAARFNSNGSFAIGTTSTGATLSLNSASAATAMRILNGNTLYADFYANSSNVVLNAVASIPLTFGTNNTERMRIDSGGNVTIRANGVLSHQFTYNENGGEIDLYDDGGNIATLIDQSFNSTRILELINGSNLVLGTGASNTTGVVSFITANSERMRITAGGNVGIGNSNPAERLAVTDSSGTTVLTIRNTNGSTNGFCLDMVATPAASTAWTFMRGYSGGSSIQYIVYGNGNVQNTNGSYGTLSDVRIKENIIDATSKLDDLLKVRVRNYNLKGDLGYNTNKQIGVIAQELETIFPGLVEDIPDKDSKGKDTGTSTKSVKMSVFTPILIKAIQEQQAMIETLQAEVALLKSK